MDDRSRSLEAVTTMFALCSLLLMPACDKEAGLARRDPSATTDIVVPQVEPRSNPPAESSHAPLVLKRVEPSGARRGSNFNVQPNGQSAFSVESDNASPTTVIYFDGRALQTTFGNRSLLTALAPPDATQSSGTHLLTLVDGERKSNDLTFVVTP